jgi:hypothetical protein
MRRPVSDGQGTALPGQGYGGRSDRPVTFAEFWRLTNRDDRTLPEISAPGKPDPVWFPEQFNPVPSSPAPR